MYLHKEEFIYQVFLDQEDLTRISEKVMDGDGHQAMWDWCDEVFGEHSEKYMHEYREVYDHDVFGFLNEEDRNWFLLRWM